MFIRSLPLSLCLVFLASAIPAEEPIYSIMPPSPPDKKVMAGNDPQIVAACPVLEMQTVQQHKGGIEIKSVGESKVATVDLNGNFYPSLSPGEPGYTVVEDALIQSAQALARTIAALTDSTILYVSYPGDKGGSFAVAAPINNALNAHKNNGGAVVSQISETVAFTEAMSLISISTAVIINTNANATFHSAQTPLISGGFVNETTLRAQGSINRADELGALNESFRAALIEKSGGNIDQECAKAIIRDGISVTLNPYQSLALGLADIVIENGAYTMRTGETLPSPLAALE